jgi:hypothetical protein
LIARRIEQALIRFIPVHWHAIYKRGSEASDG